MRASPFIRLGEKMPGTRAYAYTYCILNSTHAKREISRKPVMYGNTTSRPASSRLDRTRASRVNDTCLLNACVRDALVCSGISVLLFLPNVKFLMLLRILLVLLYHHCFSNLL
jgi:hypothetical protein